MSHAPIIERSPHRVDADVVAPSPDYKSHCTRFRQFLNADFGQIEIRSEHIHITATGQKFLVIRGDEFDAVMTYAKWLALLGDWSYSTLLSINTGFNAIRRRLGYPYWSLSAYLKHKAKRAVEFIGQFEHALATEARRRCAEMFVGNLRPFNFTKARSVTAG